MKKALLQRWHWFFISRGKQRLRRLADEGVPLSSEKVVRLGNNVTSHCLKAGLFTLSKNF